LPIVILVFAALWALVAGPRRTARVVGRGLAAMAVVVIVLGVVLAAALALLG
jgi:hypothetical protein